MLDPLYLLAGALGAAVGSYIGTKLYERYVVIYAQAAAYHAGQVDGAAELVESIEGVEPELPPRPWTSDRWYQELIADE